MKTFILNLPTLSTLFTVTFCLLNFVPNWSSAQSNTYSDDTYSVTYSKNNLELTNLKKTTNKPAKSDATSSIATYKEGKSDFEQYVRQEVAYPELAKTYGFEGTTIVRFKVLADGTLAQFTVVQSTHPICDKAVIKTLKQMPQWNAATKDGRPVESVQQVSVDFRLN